MSDEISRHDRFPREASKADIQREYDHLAGDYEHRWHRYVLRSIEETLGRAGLEPGHRVLDVGCGTGALLRAAMT